MLRILSLLLSVLILIGGIILVMGYLTDPPYKDSVTFSVTFPPEDVFEQILNITNTTERKNDVASVEILERYGKFIAWKENLKNGGYRTYRTTKIDENKTIVIELMDSSYGLKGSWTFNIERTQYDSSITIIEESALSDLKRRGYRTVMGRDVDLLSWQKYIKVGLVQGLIKNP